MKKYLGLIVILVLTFAAVTTAVHADVRSDAEATKTQIKNNIEKIRSDAKARFEALKDSTKNEKDAAKAKAEGLRITLREDALNKFDNALIRIDTLNDRTKSMLNSYQTQGLDISNSLKYTDMADTDLINAKSKIAEINTILAKSVNEISAADRAKIVTLATSTQKLLTDARAALRTAVSALKTQVDLKDMLKKFTPQNAAKTNAK